MIDYLSVGGANQTTYKQCQAIDFIGVNDGARTRDNRNHNPSLKINFHSMNQLDIKLLSNFI